MNDQIHFKLDNKTTFLISFVLTLIFSIPLFNNYYKGESSQKEASQLIDAINNKSDLYESIEGEVHALNEKRYYAPYSQTPCLLYWYHKAKKERGSSTSKSGSSYSEVTTFRKNESSPFEIRTSENKSYKIYTEMERITHYYEAPRTIEIPKAYILEYDEETSPEDRIEYNEETIPEDKKIIHYELFLAEGNHVSAFIKKDFNPEQIKSEIIILKNKREVWLDLLSRQANSKWHYFYLVYSLIIFVIIFSIISFISRNLQNVTTQQWKSFVGTRKK
jgi:hypothetical protein